jgi:Ca2+-binding EF-hand superfamily protein
MMDSNNDGKITYAEWRDSAVRSTAPNENDSTLLELWAKYDTDNVGYLTESEAINRKG